MGACQQIHIHSPVPNLKNCFWFSNFSQFHVSDKAQFPDKTMITTVSIRESPVTVPNTLRIMYEVFETVLNMFCSKNSKIPEKTIFNEKLKKIQFQNFAITLCELGILEIHLAHQGFTLRNPF